MTNILLFLFFAMAIVGAVTLVVSELCRQYGLFRRQKRLAYASYYILITSLVLLVLHFPVLFIFDRRSFQDFLNSPASIIFTLVHFFAVGAFCFLARQVIKNIRSR